VEVVALRPLRRAERAARLTTGPWQTKPARPLYAARRLAARAVLPQQRVSKNRTVGWAALWHS